MAAAHFSSVAATKALVLAFFALSLFAASSNAQDFDSPAPAPAPSSIAGAAPHSAMATGAIFIMPLFLSVLALFKH